MEITTVKTYLVHEKQRKNFIFVQLETDEGIAGWGEAHTSLDMDTAVAAHIAQMSRYVIGYSAFNIKHFTQVACDDFAWRHGSLEFYSALSGIEMAMWDIVGKAVEAAGLQPAGRRMSSENTRLRTAGSMAPRAGRAFARRRRADREAGLHRAQMLSVSERFTASCKSVVSAEGRDRQRGGNRACGARCSGPETDLMVDVCRRLAPMQAIELAERIGEFNRTRSEEPCPVDNVDALRGDPQQDEYRSSLAKRSTARAVLAVLEKRAADILNPDVCIVGGILEMKEIAAMAELHYVRSHRTTSTPPCWLRQRRCTLPQRCRTSSSPSALSLFSSRAARWRGSEIKDGYIALPRPRVSVWRSMKQRLPGILTNIRQARLSTYRDEGP
jgi:galactonate dehydratase